MTFVQLQNRVMSRLNWTSTDARDLVKNYLNERYREVCSSVGAEKTRRGNVTFTTAAGNNLVTGTGIAKLLGLYDAVTLDRPLQEVSVDDIKSMDPAADTTGTPTHYAIYKHIDDEITLLLYPEPTAIAALTADALLAGTDMSGDSDEPTIPVDFQDVLIHGAEADGRTKMEKPALALVSERKFDKRLSELRFFITKSAYLRQVPIDSGNRRVSRFSWLAP